MSKSIYSCVVEGDPIKEHEDEEYDLGYLMGQVEACRSILATHITTYYKTR